MKRIITGFIAGLLAFPLLCDTVRVASYLQPDSKTLDAAYTATLIPGYGLDSPFVGHCTKDISENGHGWRFVRREYFGCGKIAVWISDKIYGEYESK